MSILDIADELARKIVEECAADKPTPPMLPSAPVTDEQQAALDGDTPPTLRGLDWIDKTLDSNMIYVVFQDLGNGLLRAVSCDDDGRHAERLRDFLNKTTIERYIVISLGIKSKIG